MFRENIQPSLFSFEQELPKNMRKKLDSSAERYFNEIIFRNIKERDYQVLFSEKASRPNSPINSLVSALILKEKKGWSYNELMDQVMFNLKTKIALGLQQIDTLPFSRATIFNFQIRLQAHEEQTGINLLEVTFDSLTENQLIELKLKTDIQRTDSALVSSNIKRLSRVQLIIETLLRLARLVEKDRNKYFEFKLLDYKEGSQKFVYKIKSSDVPHELEKLSILYQSCLKDLKSTYSQTKEYQLVQRVYEEHFNEIDGEVKVKSNEELTSGILQSPDDEQATYRNKRGNQTKGFTINGTETANPENDIQLLTDVDVNPNNVDDSKILENKIDKIKQKTPDLTEMHTDGGYGSEGVDEKMKEHNITQITTAIRGRKSNVEIVIEKTSDNQYLVSCPKQKVKSEKTRKRNKATFNKEKCDGCNLKAICAINKNKQKLYFTENDYLKNKRSSNIKKIPKERQKLRPNVEATMHEFKAKTNGGKLKVRGQFKTELFAFAMAISINFGRIFRYVTDNSLFEWFSCAIIANIQLILNFQLLNYPLSPPHNFNYKAYYFKLF